MRLYHAAAILALLGGTARAQEDEDDPKSSHAQPVKPKAAEPKPAAPKPEPPKPEPKVEPKPEPPKPEPKAAAPKVDPKPAPPKVDPKPEPAATVVKAETPKKPAKAEPKPEPKASIPTEAAPAPNTRNVRVRLVDGSSVAGTVRAELSESLVIDCNLGLLSIPRARIANISYDAAGGAKRAPVQQLDDDLPPRKR